MSVAKIGKKQQGQKKNVKNVKNVEKNTFDIALQLFT